MEGRKIMAPAGQPVHRHLDVHLVVDKDGDTQHFIAIFDFPETASMSHVAAVVIDHHGIDWTSVVKGTLKIRATIHEADHEYRLDFVSKDTTVRRLAQTSKFSAHKTGKSFS
jgi:hypothetical protein